MWQHCRSSAVQRQANSEPFPCIIVFDVDRTTEKAECQHAPICAITCQHGPILQFVRGAEKESLCGTVVMA